jgi:tetratricopeptide (TPR) repeat protein
MLEFRLLGPVEVWAGDGRVALGRAESAKTRCMLAVLLRAPGALVTTDALIDRVWGEQPPGSAVRYKYIGWLRSALAPHGVSLAHRDAGYVLDVDAEQVDLHRFRRLVAQARDAEQTADVDKVPCLLAEALGLWRGAALSGLSGTWTELFRNQLERERRAARVLQARCALKAGATAQALEWLDEWEAEYPTDEEIIALRMMALHRSGQHAEAMACYQRACQRLRDILGVPPGSDLLVVHRRIQNRDLDTDFALSEDELGIRPSTSLRDLHEAILRQDPGLEAPASSTIATSPAPAVPLPAQLPASITAFVGRADELACLDKLVAAGSAATPSAVIVSAVSGTAGVGKTALAVHWAHRVAERFPDGQLYVNLRGFDAARAPLDPGEVLRGFLEALGVPTQRIPGGLDAQLGLYRSVLAGKRVLVLLDNARDADHVRQLLPGSPGCLAVVTSRSQLTPLVATHGARSLTLGLLTSEESRDLLGRRLGADRVAVERAAIEKIIARCAGLPLALAIVAARAETDTVVPLSVLSEQLQDSASALDTLTAGDESTDLRAVFSWSAGALSPQAGELYRLLGLHPGPDLTAAAAGSLTGTPAEQIRPWLGELVRAHLLTEHVPGRLTSHDLLRAYTAEQARTQCSDHGRHAATHRVLDHYLHTAQEAARLLYGPWDHLPLTSAQPGVTPERFADEPRATAWLHAEYQVLLGCIEHAVGSGFERHAWLLARTMATYFERSGHWRDWARVQQVVVRAAQRIGDIAGQAHAHHQLGNALIHLGDYEQADSELRHALNLFRFSGDDTHRAQVHLCIGYLFDCQGAVQQALSQSQRALQLFRPAGHHAGEAIALNNIGWSQAQQGHYGQALRNCHQALHLHEQAADRQGQAGAWDSLGYIHQRRADHPAAIACYTRAADFYRQIRDGHNEALTLTRLGDAYHAAGDHQSARHTWRQALRLQEASDHPDMTQIRRRLDQAAQQRA